VSSEDLYNKVILLQSKAARLVYEHKRAKAKVKKLEAENIQLEKELEQKKFMKTSDILTKEEASRYLKTVDACIAILKKMDHEK
jgi:predicted transcriptional regulator